MPRKPPAKKQPARKPAQLEPYRKKRNFKATPEPAAGRGKKEGRIFVVQEHDASHHHFDFRLEMNGVLASWAVPKGIPEDIHAKRLAVHVEDHPVSYASFHGVIPKGNYGAGTVDIWDSGTWEPLDRDWRKAYEKGKLKFILRGKRLEGPYLLARMSAEPNWLLRKLDPETHPTGTPVEPTAEAVAFVLPQLSRPVPTVPEGKEWVHEIKLDGYRLIAVRKKGEVKLYTRKQLDWTDRFADVASRLEKLKGGDFVMDGEAVVFNSKGHSSFSALQEALKSGKGRAITFVAFDLLNLDGRNLKELPLVERVKYLAKLLPEEQGPLRRSKVWPADSGADLFLQACKLGLEGIISKRASGRYVPESRKDWTKSKCRPRQEFVICGYTEPRNSCPAFGALVLASYENGKLIPRGKVGTGFSDESRRSLLKQMASRKMPRGPFPGEKGVTWIKPDLVAEIEFAELTHEGSIRQGSFLSLREDKPASDVHLDAVEKASAKGKGVTVAGIEITHPERVVYSDDSITKLEVARYYERVGELILPHLKDRPLALLRAPDGIGSDMFFQKSFKAHVPPHVKMSTLDDGTEVISIKNLKGLISLVQFGVIEIHPWGASLAKPDKPDQIIWDLDPDKSVPWKEVLGAAFLLRDVLEARGLQTLVKTSGGKGLHVVLHLKRQHSWEVMKSFAKGVAASVAEQNPQRFTITSSFKKRGGKIYIDWLRNGRGATCIAPWALRARPGAAVSMPLEWDQLPGLEAQGFTIREPAETPASWLNIISQSVPKALLAEFASL
ncbi:DNA ligase D [Luteolibacter luteus]|uniref:DNA ligase (ATP) n=1 Tax=Luteolibacter luteus TaxID=2728835 RepID=A0A858RGF4_9BACT|nr:DNA ligase D [Luteolibacter luteus]QJE95671.1 DNA ligase D [Luteolibacter luteus]